MGGKWDVEMFLTSLEAFQGRDITLSGANLGWHTRPMYMDERKDFRE
jgi:hypothetical protein